MCGLQVEVSKLSSALPASCEARGTKNLFFVLFYLRVYPTFDVLGALFAKPRGRSCESIHLLLPLLTETLGRKCVLPQRRIASME